MSKNVSPDNPVVVNKNRFRERAVDVVDIRELGYEAFREQYVNPLIPCILQGVIESWPAYQKWTKSFFHDELGQLPILYHHVSNDGHTLDWLKGLPRTSVSDLIDRLDRGEAVKHFEVSHPYYDFLGQNPELLEDLDLKDLASLFPSGKFLGLDRTDSKAWPFVPPYPPQLFMAGPNAVSSGHYDPDHSHTLHWCVWGCKTVKLFPYDASTSEAMSKVCKLNIYDTLDEEIIAENPILDHLDGWSVTLEPGQVLFMPSRIWHFFRYEETAMSFVARCRSFDDWSGYRAFSEDQQSPVYLLPFFSELWRACDRRDRTWLGQMMASQPTLLVFLTRCVLFFVRVFSRNLNKS
ncbi:MAG: cupin-like domain-containing protein [Mariniblastus sp.]|nr:cupin-like domain-containing protein [Mariniblastus sp.]